MPKGIVTPIPKRDLEKTETSECITRKLTIEEAKKYENIKPISKRTNADYMAHVTENR